MAENVDLKEQKALLNAARNAPLNFAVCLATKPEDTVLVMHKTKGTTPLRELAKKAGKTTKIAVGQLQVSGKKVEMICEGAPPPDAEKSCKQYFQKVMGIALDVTMAEPKAVIKGDRPKGASAETTPESAAKPKSADADAPQGLSPEVAKIQAAAKKASGPIDALARNLLGRVVKRVSAMSLTPEEKKALIGELAKGPIYKGGDKAIAGMVDKPKLRKAYAGLVKQVASKL